ncbi:MAG: DinB family protein [Saprospiraceae bacterium]|nr:DinB family protein [Saprospiraceae bacterium]
MTRTNIPNQKTNKAWQDAWDNLRLQLNELSDHQINKTPTGGGWSIQQVIQHLGLSEQLSLKYLKKKTLDPSRIPKRDMGYPFRKAALYLYLASPFRYKAPGMVSTSQFPKKEDIQDTMVGLVANQEEMIQFIQHLPANATKGMVYKHPIVGRMDLDGMFWFFTWHIRHHIRQIKRIKKNL